MLKKQKLFEQILVVFAINSFDITFQDGLEINKQIYCCQSFKQETVNSRLVINRIIW